MHFLFLLAFLWSNVLFCDCFNIQEAKLGQSEQGANSNFFNNQGIKFSEFSIWDELKLNYFSSQKTKN